MNNGAFGENFPYTNQHDLNMDWIIKIAKDFLDQYSHLEETLETGLTDLTEKAEELEGLLQEWYDTHSVALQQQIATALADAIQTFNSTATATGQTVLNTIPADYSSLWLAIAEPFSATKNYNVGDIVKTTDGNGVGHVWQFTANHNAGQWNDAEATEINLGNVLASSILSLIHKENYNGCPNLFENFLPFTAITDQGVKYSPKNKGVNLYGTSTTNSFINLFVGDVPQWLSKNHDYNVYAGDNPDAKLIVYGYPNSSSTSPVTLFDGYGTGTLNIPDSVNYLRVRIAVSNNTSFNETIYFSITDVYTNTELTAFANNIKGLKIITPDFFNGTDNQKLQSAFNYFQAEDHGVIVINRDYNTTADIYIDHQTYYDDNSRITVIGLGDRCTLSMGGGEFRGRGSSTIRNFGGITFKNIRFRGNNWAFRCTNLIRITAENCVFENFKNIVYGQYVMQSYRIHNCIIRDITEEILKLYSETDSAMYDINISNNLIERCNKIVNSYRGYNVVFSANCIEASHDLPFKFRAFAYNFVIENNYFEANNSGYNTGDTDNGGLTIDLSELTEVQGVTIAHNFFGQDNSTGVIKLPDTNIINKGTISIRENISPWNGIFIASSTTLLTPYNNVSIDNNFGEISDPNKLVFQNNTSNNSTMTVGNNSFTLKRNHRSVNIIANNITFTGTADWVTLLTGIPSGYRPNTDVYASAISGNSLVNIRVTTTGTLEVNAPVGNHTINLNTFFII